MDRPKARSSSIEFEIEVYSFPYELDDSEDVIRTAGWHIEDMLLQENLCGLRIWPVDVKRNGFRAFSIDQAVIWCLYMMLPLCHGVKGLKVVMIAGDVIFGSGVNNPISGRSIC